MQNIGGQGIKPPPTQLGAIKINLYSNYPDEDITFEHFQKACINRVKFLRDIENMYKIFDQINNLNFREEQALDGADTSGSIKKIQATYGFDYEHNAKQAYQEDEISHFVGRLGYCKTEALQQWFVKQECRLFKARMKGQTTGTCKEILADFGIVFQSIDSKFWKENSQDIISGNGQKEQNQDYQYCKIRFENAIELVSKLKCYLHQGYAYIYQQNLSKILIRHYKSKLIKNLKICKQFLNQIIENDERIGPIINMMTEVYFGNEYNLKQITSKKGSLNLADLEIIYQRSFPPCMLNLMIYLKENHHLKHFGRLQLGLFLKGAGLTLQDSLKFWKAEFTKKISAEQFEKQYAYNIKHNYGQIGKKCDYTPKSCLTIMKEKPGESEHHGCPFVVFNQQHLKILLAKLGLTESKYKSELHEILQKAKDQQSQAACRKTFIVLHQDCQTENVGQHPNSYFEESMKFYQGDIKKENQMSNVNKIEEEKAPGK